MSKLIVLLGETNSWRDNVAAFLAMNPRVKIQELQSKQGGVINVYVGNLSLYELITKSYISDEVVPVYITTPGDVVLGNGFKEVETGDTTYIEICERYVEEAKDLSPEVLHSINAIIVAEDNLCEACYAVMRALKKHFPDIIKGDQILDFGQIG